LIEKMKTEQNMLYRPGEMESARGGEGRARLPVIPGTWMVLATALSGVAVALMMVSHHLTIVPTGSGIAAVTLVLLLLGAVRYMTRNPATPARRQARDFAESVLLFFSISLLGVIASYPQAMASTGFADPALAHVDRLLHFNWVAWYIVVSDHPSLQIIGATAYASIYVTPTVLLGYFALAGRRDDARQFLATFWLAAVLSLLLFLLMPAEGPLA
jgi:hypothetical protein